MLNQGRRSPGREIEKLKRNLSLTARAAEILTAGKAAVKGLSGDSREAATPGTSIDHQHDDVRATLKLSKEFVGLRRKPERKRPGRKGFWPKFGHSSRPRSQVKLK